MYLVKLWFSIFMVGLIFYPVTSSIFKKFNDKGWIFSKIIGISISGWLMWFLSYLKLLEYTKLNCYLILLLFGIINIIIIYIKHKKKEINIKKPDIVLIKNIIVSEVLFILGLSFWTYIKGFSQGIETSTEQFMDYGFLNSIMNTSFMPPADIWLSGESINYYYFGQYLCGFICKIAGLTASEGYYLMIAFVATCTFILPFSIGYNLFSKTFKNKKEKKYHFIWPIIVALFIGIACSLGGSLHYPIYKWIDFNKSTYSYMDETRYIGYKPDVEDKTATEVPAYSSIVGDLHAHYIDIAFSLTTIALLVQYFITEIDNKKRFKDIKYYLHLFLIALMLGIQKMTNFWDFPIYIVIISAIIITKELICNKCSIKNIVIALASLLGIVFTEELLTILFTMDLTVNGTTICFTNIMSPFYKLLIKWGLPTLCAFGFLTILFLEFKKSQDKFKTFLNKHLPDLFVIIIALCAFGLVLLPEIIYVKDIYEDNYKRFNTMFKLTYQAFVLFSLSTNYILFKLVLHKNKAIGYVSIILLTLSITTIGYGIDAIISCYRNVERQDISASNTESYIRKQLPEDYKAIEWIRKNVDKNAIILEACKSGNSYSVSSRISTFTGNSTVEGWSFHEWIWRYDKDYSMPEELKNRINDIATIYTVNNDSMVRTIIEKYNIDYIYIGQVEFSTYNNINIDFLASLGDVVYQGNSTFLIHVSE